MKEGLILVKMLLECEDERQKWNLRRSIKLLIGKKSFKMKLPKYKKLGRNIKNLLSTQLREEEIREVEPKDEVVCCFEQDQ